MSTTTGHVAPILLTGILVLISVLCCGCKPSATPLGPNSTFGKVGQTSYLLLRWRDGTSVMMWFDAQQLTGGGSGSSGEATYRQTGSVTNSDGRRVEWRVETTNATLITIEIDGTQYDLAQGTLFLVKTRGGETQVQQLKRDLTTMKATREGCVALAETDTDVKDFVREADEE